MPHSDLRLFMSEIILDAKFASFSAVRTFPGQPHKSWPCIQTNGLIGPAKMQMFRTDAKQGIGPSIATLFVQQ